MVKDAGKQAAGAGHSTVSCLLDDIRQSSLLEQHHNVDSDVLSLGTYSNETSLRRLAELRRSSSEPTPRLASQGHTGVNARSRLHAGPEPEPVGLQAMLRAVAKVHIESQGVFLIPRGGEPGDDFLVRRFHQQHLARTDMIVSTPSKLCSVL